MPAHTLPRPPAELAARWTLAQYEQLVETGVLDRRRVELIAGQITRMSPASPAHDACVSIVADYLRERIDRELVVREEKGIALPELASMPEPDVVLCDRRADLYAERKPTPADTHLLVEVALSSLPYDREVKAPLYAAGGVREYWIVDLSGRRLERYRLAEGADAYGDPDVLAEADTLEHDSLGAVAVADLLPMVG